MDEFTFTGLFGIVTTFKTASTVSEADREMGLYDFVTTSLMQKIITSFGQGDLGRNIRSTPKCMLTMSTPRAVRQ